MDTTVAPAVGQILKRCGPYVVHLCQRLPDTLANALQSIWSTEVNTSVYMISTQLFLVLLDGIRQVIRVHTNIWPYVFCKQYKYLAGIKDTFRYI